MSVSLLSPLGPRAPMKATKAHWPTVVIVGVGLIGGSIGLALKARKRAGRVIGVGRSPASLAEAKRLHAIDEAATDLAAAVAVADLVVVATGVASIPGILDQVDAAARPGTLVTDAGSTKARIVAAWEKRRRLRGTRTSGSSLRGRQARFVGAHPVAGSHRRGPAAADPQLFQGRVTVVTPAAATPAADVEAITDFWSALGSNVATMTPRDHDRILAMTSHAPWFTGVHTASATTSGGILARRPAATSGPSSASPPARRRQGCSQARLPELAARLWLLVTSTSQCRSAKGRGRSSRPYQRERSGGANSTRTSVTSPLGT